MSVSRLRLRHLLAERVGPFAALTSTAVGSSTVIFCTTAFQSTERPVSAAAFEWAYVPSVATPKQRRTTPAGFSGANGSITLEAALGGAVGNGVAFELLGKLPATREESTDVSSALQMGIHECLNAALSYLRIEREETISITTGQEYDLSSLAWLDRPERVRYVLGPPLVPGKLPRPITWRRPHIEQAGSTTVLRLEAPFDTALGSITLGVVQPANTRIKRSGNWVTVTDGTGLASDTDEADLDEREIIEAALYFAYASLASIRPGQQGDHYAGLAAAQLARARQLRAWDASIDNIEATTGKGDR